MSQNTILTSSNFGQVRVSAGWDHPLSELFCNVLPLNEENEDEESGPEECLLRSSYDDVEDMLETLQRFGISLPAPMVEAIKQDVQAAARNIVRVFKPDGTLEAEHHF